MLKSTQTFLLVYLCAFSVQVLAQTSVLGALSFEIPSGWKLHQQLQDQEKIILGYEQGDEYVRMYFFPSGQTPKSIATPKGMTQEQSKEFNGLNWSIKESKHQLPVENGSVQYYVTSFSLALDGAQYFGYSESITSGVASKNVESFLEKIQKARSLTTKNYPGKKYYVGFGDYLFGYMGNEVKYDIQHTHDIFTNEVGGSYIGYKIHGWNMGAHDLRQKWSEIKSQMTPDDMYVQYSSGHGYYEDLAFGVSYNEIRDNALNMPAKEVIIFLMSCHSGGIVESFNQVKQQWSTWKQDGRTLMVMASSGHLELSGTGPGTDPQEPGGPYGSAGSAFGHSLWKALIGHADGHGEGLEDGYLSLGEIIDYTIWKTQQVSFHTPVFTGTFNRNLIMNRVPPTSYLNSLDRGTHTLSDKAIIEQIQQLDEQFRL